MAEPSHPSAPTEVVTCFVLRDAERTDAAAPATAAVLLVQRSQHVRTYRGAWAAISGYLESGVTPIEQAYTELREELGLTRDDLELRRSGAPLAVSDPQAQLEWVVHPFLFVVRDTDRIRTDWEATQHAWVAPADVGTYDTVPGLQRALAAVYPADTPVDG